MSFRVILVWKADAQRGQYIPVGILSRNGSFEFRYLLGVNRAEKLGFMLPPEFPDTDRVYRSEQLFAIFRNRLMNRSRRSLGDYLEAMELSPDPDPLLEMARTGGKRATDRFRVVSIPEPIDGNIELIFLLQAFPVWEFLSTGKLVLNL